MEKSDIYPLEKVNERISYYTKSLSSIENEALKSINQNLLKFWENYKSKNYPNGKANS